ncbi:hypothetical protein AFEL58S_02460 [Afipia felis]
MNRHIVRCRMLSYLKRRYPDLRLVRMSDGRWSVIRDLGLVKGGKGLRCHECVFSFRLDLRRLLVRRRIASHVDVLTRSEATLQATPAVRPLSPLGRGLG